MSVMEQQVKKKGRIYPTNKRSGSMKVETLLDFKDYLKNISNTNLKDSPKPTPQKYVTASDFADFKKELIRLFHNNPIIEQEKTPVKSEIKEEIEENTDN